MILGMLPPSQEGGSACGLLEDGSGVAVKVLEVVEEDGEKSETQQQQDSANRKQFDQEIMTLSKYRHRNILSLIGFCPVSCM